MLVVYFLSIWIMNNECDQSASTFEKFVMCHVKSIKLYSYIYRIALVIAHSDQAPNDIKMM